MSYAEVERGLPPVNTSNTPIWVRRMQHSPGPKLHDHDPDHETEGSTAAYSNGSNQEVTYANVNPRDSQGDLMDEPPSHIPPTPPRIPSTQRYIISDDDNEMRVFKVDPNQDPGATNRYFISGSAAEAQVTPASRSKQICSFVLCLVPPIFFVLALQFMKFEMSQYPYHCIGLCLFQSIFWTCLIIGVIQRFWFKMNTFECFSCSNSDDDAWKNWIDIMLLNIFATGALLLQMVAILYLDITVALSITFTPLVIAAFIRHIHREREFSLELLFTSILAYLGLVLIVIPAVITDDRNYRDAMIFGFGAAMGSMMLTIPACFILERLRRNKIEDSVTGTGIGLLGTAICVIMGIVLGFAPENYHPEVKAISAVCGFTILGVTFLFVEASLRAKLQRKTESPGARAVHICRTRVCIFILSGIWEIFKRLVGLDVFSDSDLIVYSIFGVVLEILSYLFTVAYESWVDWIKTSSGNQKSVQSAGSRRFHFVPWLFSKK